MFSPLALFNRYRCSRRKVTDKNLSLLSDIELDGVCSRDYPDFSDAHITCAVWKDSGVELTDAQLEQLNGNGSFVYECIIDKIF